MNRLSMQCFVAQCAITLMLVASSAKGYDGIAGSDQTPPRQYTFSWMFTEAGTMKPRGGTTSGPEVQLDRRTSEAFTNLQAPNLDVKERDRRAILRPRTKFGMNSPHWALLLRTMPMARRGGGPGKWRVIYGCQQSRPKRSRRPKKILESSQFLDNWPER